MRQPFVAPTSMYSMKRSVTPVPRKWRASGTICCSLTPRLTTQLTLTGSPTACGRLDALEHARDREVDVVHRLEDRVVERVEADGDALQAGVLERLRLLRQQRGVGRQRQVEPASAASIAIRLLDADAQQRLAAGEAELRDADLDRCGSEPRDLLEGEQLLAVEEAVVLAEHLFGMQ